MNAAERMAADLDAVEGGSDATRRCAELTYRTVTPNAGDGVHKVHAGAFTSHRAWAEQVKAARLARGSRRGFGQEDSRIWYEAGRMLADGEADDPGEAYSAARLTVRPRDTSRVRRAAAVATELADPRFAQQVAEKMPDPARTTMTGALVDARVAQVRHGSTLGPSQPHRESVADAILAREEAYGRLFADVARIVATLVDYPPTPDEAAEVNQALARVFEAMPLGVSDANYG